MKPSASKKRPKVWGLTGGVAAGKSLAARCFEREGLPVIDADQIARELRAPGGAAYEPILQRFGTADPQKLRAVVFSGPGAAEARRALEAILHPLIREESERRFQALSGQAIVIYEAALLVENGRYKNFDGLIVVDAPEDVRRDRLMARDGITPETADKILRSQIAPLERLKAADHVLKNAGIPEDLAAQVHALVSKLKRAHRA